jgi:hypothetical protein
MINGRKYWIDMAAGRNLKEDAIVWERDEHKCSYCGNTDDLQIHHVTYRSKFGKRHRDSQELARNKVLLCARCHDLTHRGIFRVIYSISDLDRPIVVTEDNWNNKINKKDYIKEIE